MKVFLEFVTGYTSEPDWITKIKHKNNIDSDHILKYFDVFHITNITIISKVYENSSCISSYILNINYNDFQHIDIHSYMLNIEQLKKYFTRNWSTIKYSLEEEFDTIRQTGNTTLKFICTLYNLDEYDINNVFEIES